MANWESLALHKVISLISSNNFVLPVIQRRLVWSEDKMVLLFDTLLKGDSFGGIMVIKEERETQPLFAFRYFTKDGSDLSSIDVTTLDQDIYLVIDGQQRLQSFYIGLVGSFKGKLLYFNLLSNCKELEYDFGFAQTSDDLDQNSTRDDGMVIRNIWVTANSLYNKLKVAHDPDQIADEIIKNKCITEEEEKSIIRKNINTFYKNIFMLECIGLSSVFINKTYTDSFNRLKIVEEFKRLNDGGTRLSAYDLFASKLKAFNWKMERFLDDILSHNSEINVTQEFLLKLIFILQDDYNRDMSSMQEVDADFAVNKKERIICIFNLLKKYLQFAELDNYYKNPNRSEVPLYFILYHFYHKSIPTENLNNILDDYDTNNEEFKRITKWMYLSLLNGVFSRGRGWIPYKTGIRKLLLEIKKHKNKVFPLDKLLNIYKAHPLKYWDSDIISESTLHLFDEEFLFYLIYDRKLQGRITDVDHIHPKSKLEALGIDATHINRIGNFQLLDYGTNRNEKRAKLFCEWVTKHVDNKSLYITRHLIPDEVPMEDGSSIWDIKNYNVFINSRSKMISEKIQKIIKSYD